VSKEKVPCKNEHHDTKSEPSYCAFTHTLLGNKVGIVEEYLLDLKKEKKIQFTSSSQIQCVDINKLKELERL
jgi:hypothetical protein